MNNNVLIKKETTLFEKIKRFFKKFFLSKKELNNEYEQEEIIQSNNKNDNSFFEDIKVEVKNEYALEMQREDFLDEIKQNPEILYSFSIQKLKVLEQYYIESIKRKKEKLAKMQNV